MNTESEIKVSILVAIYNSESFLDLLIKSVMGQTYRNLEIILVNDGSPDKSGEICDNYAKEDNRIKVIHKPNGGCCDARNKGMEHVTGEYLSIIDGDDWLEPDYVEYLLGIALEYKSDMSMSLNIFTTRDRVQIDRDLVEIWTAEKAATEIIYPRVPIGPWNKLYKTSLIKNNNINFNVPWSGEGHYFTTMAAEYSNQVSVGRRKVYNYRLNNACSGLTNYKVIMGTNALWNTQNIWKKSIIRTPAIENAIRYHIWFNYHFIIKLIIATESYEQYNKEYKESLLMIRKMLPLTLLKSDVTLRERWQMIKLAAFPKLYARRFIKAEKTALTKDLTKLVN